MRRFTSFLTQAAVAGAIAAVAIIGARGLMAQAESGEESVEPAASEDGAPVQACDLLTAEEAAAALGTEVSQMPDPGQCTYVAKDATGRSVSVALPSAALPPDAFASGVDQAAAAFNGESRVIAGVGDEAHAILSSVMSQALGRVGDKYVVVVLTSPAGSPDEQTTLLTDLLQTALSRR